MKTLFTLIIAMVFTFAFGTTADAQYTYKKADKDYWTISPAGGFILPVGEFNDIYKASPRAGLDVTYKVNREVGIYGNVSYNALQNKDPQGPTSSYISATVGPRYYFYDPDLKSNLFLEGGVGAYIFNSDAYTIQNQQFDSESETRPGVNAGVGASLNLSENVDIFLKGKYNSIFRTGGTSSFIGTDAGLTIKF